MEKLEIGDIAVLNNGKEYICFNELTLNNLNYVYLVSNFKPLEVFFAKENLMANGEIELAIVENKEEKEMLFNLLANQNKKEK